MLEFAYKYLENVIYYREELYTALGETIIMVFIAGIILGIALAVTKKNGILENTFINTTLARIINILRSIPFVILLAALIPVTRFIVGTTIGLKGAIVPLIFGSAPFIARQIEISSI